MKIHKIVYWTSTGLLTLFMLLSAGMMIFNNAEVREQFIKFGYSPHIVYVLGVAKILGLIAILTKKSKILKELAYAGFFINFILALFAHLQAKDGEFGGAVIALVLLLVSYIFDKKLYSNKRKRRM